MWRKFREFRGAEAKTSMKSAHGRESALRSRLMRRCRKFESKCSHRSSLWSWKCGYSESKPKDLKNLEKLRKGSLITANSISFDLYFQKNFVCRDPQYDFMFWSKSNCSKLWLQDASKTRRDIHMTFWILISEDPSSLTKSNIRIQICRGSKDRDPGGTLKFFPPAFYAAAVLLAHIQYARMNINWNGNKVENQILSNYKALCQWLPQLNRWITL